LLEEITMKIISHRGNVCGRNVESENHPTYIMQAVAAGFDAEIDVWWIDGKFMLGHDNPQYEVDVDFLKSLPLWCHAKNADALGRMLEEKVHCFWHETDAYTITSNGSIWCYIGNRHANGITVFLGEPDASVDRPYGVCTDYPIKWKEMLCT
jgi:hypothetical protein